MSEINHEERSHSPVGASSSKRWMSCPASVRLSEGIENKSSDYAKEGTRAHEFAEFCLEKGIDPLEFIGKEFQDLPVSEEMAEAIKIYTDYLLKESKGKELEIETKFCLDRIDKDLFGTNDACIVDPFISMNIIDLKYGKGLKVNAEENTQLMYYALGVWDGECEDITLTIVQPRRPDSEGNCIHEWKTNGDRLRKFEKELKEAVSKTRDPKCKPVAGDHCRFCLAAPTCEGLRNKAMEVASTTFEEVTIDLPKPKELTKKQLTKALQGAKLLSTWIKSVESYGEQLLNQGQKIDGFKLVKKRAIRKWKEDIDGQLEDLESIFGENIYEPKKLKSPAKLEKIVGKKNIEEYTYKPETGTTVAPSSDKRPEVEAEVKRIFTKID